MKGKISYEAWEEVDVAAIVAFMRRQFPGIKVHKSDNHPPYKHLYLTTRKSKNPCETKENTCHTPSDVV